MVLLLWRAAWNRSPQHPVVHLKSTLNQLSVIMLPWLFRPRFFFFFFHRGEEFQIGELVWITRLDCSDKRVPEWVFLPCFFPAKWTPWLIACFRICEEVSGGVQVIASVSWLCVAKDKCYEILSSLLVRRRFPTNKLQLPPPLRLFFFFLFLFFLLDQQAATDRNDLTETFTGTNEGPTLTRLF